jgi:asparagine synthase (glutamine-hydrolysing)
MCGIVGLFGNVDNNLLKEMSHLISHRGPDGRGYYFDKGIALGHRRLSIIDLKGGSQPMQDQEGKFVITFNGEIYNYLNLKFHLEGKGIKFSTNSDTEVILNMYKIYGKNCLNYLEGMFSFVIYDLNKKSLFVARDRLGIKPLYYFRNSETFGFASEIKSLLIHPDIDKSINKNALLEYFYRQYISGSETIFNQIYKLPPGHYIFIENGELELKKYWDLAYTIKEKQSSNAKLRIKSLFDEAVEKRLISDVPIGIFLSGGLDSSLVLNSMSKFYKDRIKTFSIGFCDREYDESKYASEIASHYGTEHNSIILNKKHMKDLNKVIYHLDEPLADFASLPTYVLSKFASEKVKVVLTGEGGDENFGGYSYYKKFEMMNKKIFIPKKILYNKKIFYHEKLLNKFLLLDKFRESKDHMKEKLVNNYFNKGDFFNQMLKWDTKIWLPDDLLMKVDKTTMAFGLEARVPFLDHKFMEYVATLDPKLKVQKAILKETYRKELPSKVLNRKKHGFEVPVEKWFKESHKEDMQNIVDSNLRVLSKYFKIEEINKLLKKKESDVFTWRFYNFIVWYQKYLNDI